VASTIREVTFSSLACPVLTLYCIFGGQALYVQTRHGQGEQVFETQASKHRLLQSDGPVQGLMLELL
jgi:hypothetical protein